MATQVQIRRGTAAQHASFVGAPSEITHDTTNNLLIVHDGVTPGGHKPPSPADFAAALAAKQNLDEKGTPNGYASLGADGKVPTAQLPDDIGATTEVIRPTNVSPANATTDIPASPAFLASTFYSQYSQAHAATQLQISDSAVFGTPFYDSGDVAATAAPTIPSGTLTESTLYYWRMRYKNTRGTWSAWSAPTSFMTASTFNAWIPTPVATPENYGDALEGGFYSGMIWNELVQSSTSMTIGTGSKTFAVPDMNANPIVYAGQQLEIRSRANPNNKMIGTVTGAGGTSLTVSVSSVDGSGTFTDWSIMSRYRVLVAPKASGENAGIALKADNSALPSACQTLNEGLRATQAMKDADTSTVYPAAWWARGLNIGGRSDWYIPARDELDLLWRNLKPATDGNYVTANRAIAAYSYATNGAYGDIASSHGLNNNSAPQYAAHTTSVPAQTLAAAFKTGGAEAFAYGGAFYWASTDCTATVAWCQGWHSSSPGAQVATSVTSPYRVRAVRRSII